MQTIAIRPGVTIAYEDHFFGEPWTGTPETVVMIHGNSESSRSWAPWVPHLARHYRVVRPDLPGFGSSPVPDGYTWSAAELAADIGRFADALKLDRFHLIGAKYGGSACMRLACDQPGRLITLSLFSGAVRGSGGGNAEAIRTKGVRQWAADTMRSRLGSAAPAAQVAWWTDQLMGKSDPRATYGASAARVDMELEHELHRITAPTLYVTTEGSGLHSVEDVEKFVGQIPVARILVMPGDSFHIAAVEPDACAKHALQFMQSFRQRPAQAAE
jgi:pimeloyl-ACP methyl ester carboxylesterase